MPGGRPTDYRPEYCDKIIELGRQGKFEAAWCVACNISSKSTLHVWKEKHPEFAEAFARARLECENYWDEETAKAARTNSGSSPLLKFLQAAVFGKKEVNVTEHAGEIITRNVTVDFGERDSH